MGAEGGQVTERSGHGPVRRGMPWWLENVLGFLGLPVAAVAGLFTIRIWYWHFDPIIGDTGGLEPVAWGLVALRDGLVVWLLTWAFPGVHLRHLRRVTLVLAVVAVVGVMHHLCYGWASNGGNR